MPKNNDPLGIRTGARFVLERARQVQIDAKAVEQIARQIAEQPEPDDAPSWEADHPGTADLNDQQLANFVLVLDALNFYFWGEPRWRVAWQGRNEDGYHALTLALGRALAEGFPITDAEYLAAITERDLAHILRGESDSIIPMLPARVQNLREAGQALLRQHDGEFLTAVLSSNGSATTLLQEIITLFPSFVDVRAYDDRVIPFYKRAQILVSDLAGAFASRGRTLFDDLSILTAFADYKVPQVLHQLGALRYSPGLEQTLQNMELIPAGAPEEVEIRAVTVVAVDQISAALRAIDNPMPEYAVDWFLWDLGQRDSDARLPYHRTPTIAY